VVHLVEQQMTDEDVGGYPNPDRRFDDLREELEVALGIAEIGERLARLRVRAGSSVPQRPTRQESQLQCRWRPWSKSRGHKFLEAED
jgi:hypothetical protein